MRIKKNLFIKYFLLCLTILTLFSFKSLVVNAATDHHFSFSAYDLDPIAGTGSGNELAANADVEPGKVFGIRVLYTNGDTKVANLQYAFNYDSTLVEPVTVEGNVYSEFDDSTTYEGGIWPSKGTTTATLRNNTNWTYLDNLVVADSQIRGIVEDSTNNTVLTATNGVLVTYYFKVKEAATPGSVITFNYAYSGYADTAVEGNLPVTADSFSLAVYGDMSSDTTLSALSVMNGTTSYSLSPTFTAGSTTKTYSTTVPNSISSINLASVATEGHAVILGGNETKTLSVGDNSFQFTVTAQDGTVSTYTVNVKRLSNDASLSSLSLTNGVSIGTFSTGTYTYSATVPYATTNTTVSATTTHANATTVGTGVFNFTNSGATLNTKVVTVSAENCSATYSSVTGNVCTTQTYTINVTRTAPSTNSYLSNLTVDGTTVTGFNKTTQTYNLANVSNATTSIVIAGVVEDTGKAVISSGLGTKSLSVGNNTFNIVVTAEDLTTRTYTINVRRLSNDSKLKTLTVSSTPTGVLSPSFTSTFYDYYTYTFDSTVPSVTIAATLNDSTATITSGPGTYVSTTPSVDIIVTAEDGTISTYVVKLVKGKSTNNNLSSLSINPGSLNETFNSATTIYTATVAGTVSSIDVSATLSDSLSTIVSGTGTHALSYGSNVIQVRVLSEAGATKDYTITITRLKKTIATLSDLTVNSTTVTGFNSSTLTYTLADVPYSTTSLAVGAVLTDSDATVTGTGTINLNTGSNTINVVVTAHDGTTKQTYTINVNRIKNNVATINSLTVAGLTPTWNSTDNQYEVEVPNTKSSLLPGDVVVTLTDTNASIVKDTTLALSTTSDNYYNFTVTAEDGLATKSYKIKIVRTKSSVSTISNVSLTSMSGVYSTTCTISSNSCTMTVPVLATDFTLTVTPTSTAAVVTGNGTYSLLSSTLDVPVTVTAEDGTISSYTITVNREKSSNANLSALTIDGTSVDSFSPSTVNYSKTVNGTVTSINIGAVVEDTGKATIVSGTGTKTLNYGSNVFEVRVLAENGTSDKVYTITVIRLKKTIATLDDLTVNSTTVTGFSSTDLSYTLSNVSYNTTSLVVGASLTDSDATMTGTGTINLNTGSNTINVVVTAHDGITKKTYTLNVYREKNNVATINSLTVAGLTPTWNSTDNQYEVEVPNTKSSLLPTDVVVTLTDTNASIVKDPTLALSTTSDNYYNFTVTSEDGLVNNTYKVKVTRVKSAVATLSSLTVTNGSFSPSFTSNTKTYTVMVPTNTTTFTVGATTTDSTATINSGVATFSLTASTMQVQVVVTAEDSVTTETYYLNIQRIPSSDNTLSSLTITPGSLNQTFNPDVTNYTATVAGTVTSVDVGVVLNDSTATIVSGTGTKNLIVGTNTVTVRIKSESGATKDYTVVITRLPKNISTLSDIKVDGTTITGFDKDTYSYTLGSVIYTKSSVTIGASVSDTDATVTGTGTKTLATGDNALKVVVTAQDGTTSTYTINIYRAKNDVAILQTLSLAGYSITPTFASGTFNYEVVVPNSVKTISPTDITAVPKDTNATVLKDGTVTLSTTNDNYYNISVTSENGLVNNVYTIKVKREKSSDTKLSSIGLTNASLSPSFVATTKSYTVTVPFGQTTFSVNGVVNDSTTTLTGNGTYTVLSGEAADGVVELVTTAEDGSVATYTLNIVTALSNDATLASLSVTGYNLNKTFASTALTYDIGEIPYNTSQLIVNAVSSNSNATIKYYVADAEQTNNTVTIPQILGENSIRVTVTAADGVTSANYRIYYKIAASSDAYLSSLTTSSGTLTFTKTTYSYIVNVDNSVTSLDLGITTEEANATYTLNGTGFLVSKTHTLNSLAVGNNTYTIVVTAQDETTTKIYNVVINRASPAANPDATLSSLGVVGYSLLETFESGTLEYNIGTIPYSLTSLVVNAVPTYGESTLTYIVNGVTQTGNTVTLPKTNGTSTIEIKVTAEDNVSTNTYKIRYTKTASSNCYLSSITPNQGSVSFNKNTLNYSIDYSIDVTSLNISLVAEDSNATIKVGNTTYSSPQTITKSLVEGKNTLVITVIAEDNVTSKTYTLDLNRADGLLRVITSNTFGHSIIDDNIETVADNITSTVMKTQLDNELQYLEIWTALDDRKVLDTEIVATGMIIKLMINSVENDRKFVIIKGDTSGDGIIDLFDSVKILNHYLGKSTLTGPYLEAGLISSDTTCDLFDAVKVLNHYLGKSLLH